MGAALLCVESSAATVGQQIHTHNTTDYYDLHHISRSHTTFQVSTLNCMIPNDIYRSQTTYQGSTLPIVILHHISGATLTIQGYSYTLCFVIVHYVSGPHPTLLGSILWFIIPYYVSWSWTKLSHPTLYGFNPCFMTQHQRTYLLTCKPAFRSAQYDFTFLFPKHRTS